MWRMHGRKLKIFKGKLHKATRVVLGEEIEVKGKYKTIVYTCSFGNSSKWKENAIPKEYGH